jgi:hypothetical protein
VFRFEGLRQNQVNDAKWNLVTGDKKIYTLARKSYLAVKLKVNYTIWCIPKIVLVDTKKRVRGF